MARDKVTIREVAKEAGVSIATVSYVINNRTDIKISDETRKKVLQVINLLDYTPNQAAKALAANRKSLFAFYNPTILSPLHAAESLYNFQLLTNYFHKHGYETILLNSETYEKCDQADAILCYDVAREDFFKLGDNNFIPLLALNCIVDDPLFFQLNVDPARISTYAKSHFGRKKYKTLMLSTPNEAKKSYYSSNISNLSFISSFEELSDIKNQNIAVSDHVLYELLKANNNVCYIPSISDATLDKLSVCLDVAMHKTKKDQHSVFI